MKILITSGGTSEPIDQVRSLTNHATGRLGQLIAQTFLDHDHEVTLITSPNSHRPQPHSNLQLIEVKTVADLQVCLQEQVAKHEVLIHSMAVSDYSPIYMTDLDELKQNTDVARLLSKKNTQDKISSAADYQVLFLKKTPKLIKKVKEWNPTIRLIGFKLLVNVSQEELLQIAQKSLKINQAELIVANDLSQITGDQHKAYLLDKTGYQEVHSKQEIAQAIYERVVKQNG
ncbi:phosphopantothenate--cysteine ligase [Streptococcus sp. sy018]|uniref:phosphopantothenate--cysteine ligase n=1 Tax=Streptococcus sp. sy018 TaxID=2600147 RepID=UPI0011B43316|nr:phosphopantothenate--cysteine ligase [Streptococcus sp. sy018]TWS95581.1 phosphopantothenate--cysteine ligase [Streptococcus sp. sy018]